MSLLIILFFFFFNDTATTEIYTLSLHDALPICQVFLDPVSLGRRRREQRVGFGLAQPAVEARRALIVELASELLRGGLRARRLQPQRDRDRFGCVRGPQVLGFAGRRRRVVRDGARLHRGAGRDRWR